MTNSTNSDPPRTTGPADSPTSSSTRSPTTPPGLESTLSQRQTWAELADQIAGPDPVVETYLDKVGRLNMARLQATEILLAETTPTPGRTMDFDAPLPPDLPADPTHRLHTDADLMSDQEYAAELTAWRQTEEYQIPLRRYQTWQQRRRDG